MSENSAPHDLIFLDKKLTPFSNGMEICRRNK